MFRNPVFDLMVVVPALLISGLVGFFIMTTAAHAQELDVIPSSSTSATTTTTGAPAVTASTSGTTFPDSTQKVLSVTRANLGVDPGSDATITPLSVRTSSDLLAYARMSLRSDPYMASLTLSGKGVVVSYRKHGRILGLVPVAVPTTATVHTDGTVTFSEPWYGAITIAQIDHMKTALEVRVHALLTSEGYLESMSLAPATQAEIVEIIKELVA